MPFAPVHAPLAQRVADLEVAIASVTRALGWACGEAVVVLASERAAMRAELRELVTSQAVLVRARR